MIAPASPALDQALQLAEAARRAELEELAFLVSFMTRTGREVLIVPLPNKVSASWTYEYQATEKDKRGYAYKYPAVTRVRFVQLERQAWSDESPLRFRGGPSETYTTAVSFSYSCLRDRVGGFQELVNAIVAYITKQTEHNATGRDDALKSLAGAGGAA